MWPLTHITITVDATGICHAASVTTEPEHGRKSVRPVRPGPFDTPGEVFQRLCEEVDTQLRLW